MGADLASRAWLEGGVAALVACAVSAVLTWLAIHYAHRRALIDHPGQRRSHTVPTPRGGGIGLVVAAVAATLLLRLVGSPVAMPLALAVGLMVAVALVAAVGWIDDHRGLAARWRFAVHGIAAAIVLGADHAGPLLYAPAAWLTVAIAAALWLAIVWSINLHNFMDGINGLLATQAIFVFVALAGLFHQAGTVPGAVAACAVFAAATVGFLPFNFPHARIFMGDVGSGVLGLLVALVVLWQLAVPGIAPASGLVLCSAFVTDASGTLLSRMLRGRRWYSAHREHLYQWLVRCGFTHAQVVALYMGWNLLLALPVVYWMNRMPEMDSSLGIGAAIATYALAGALWWLGKRACLRAVRRRGLHATA
jgi:UDP-N-acetylmuramyl pentapeptide phosphotransferase/UDP-N-acetylglucosamine-1-phosphate transferase